MIVDLLNSNVDTVNSEIPDNFIFPNSVERFAMLKILDLGIIYLQQ